MDFGYRFHTVNDTLHKQCECNSSKQVKFVTEVHNGRADKDIATGI